MRLSVIASMFLCTMAHSRAGPDTVSAAVDDGLPAALRALDGLRQGPKTPFPQADKIAADLLKKYPDPKDQGQIYFVLVQVYGQSAGPAQRIIDYAKKALQFPLEPAQRSRLHTYWGNSLFMLEPADPVPERRKAAAAVFLEGLRELDKLNLPEEPPAVPLLTLDSVETTSETTGREAKEQNRRDVAAVEQARFVRAMIRQREILRGQLVWLYARKPLATEELGKLLMESTKDAALADRLVKAVEAKVQATNLATEVPSPKQELDSPPNRGRYVLVVAWIVLVGLIVLLVLRTRRAHRRKSSG